MQIIQVTNLNRVKLRITGRKYLCPIDQQLGGIHVIEFNFPAIYAYIQQISGHVSHCSRYTDKHEVIMNNIIPHIKLWSTDIKQILFTSAHAIRLILGSVRNSL